MTARIARRRIVGTTAAGLLVLGLAAGCGSSDDDSGSTTTTEADAESTTTTEAGVATTTSAPDGSTTTAASGEAAGGEPTIDGGSSVTGEVAGRASVEFSVSVPDGVRARLTATPDGDYDIVVEGNGQVVDGGGRGEPETVLIIGPDDFTLEVHGLLAHSAGTFTVTIERAS